jgi:hypothetical protein
MKIERKLPRRPKNFWYWCTLGAVSTLLCLPVLSVTYVPLVDYPNHLARVHILYEYANVPAYQSTYYRVLEPIPNLAIELVISLLLPFVDILVAGKIFLVLAILLLITGCHQIGTAIHGRPTWLVLPCLFFFYNSMFFYGFVNYMFGIGLFCLTVAHRLKLRNRWSGSRLLILTLLSLLAFIAHLTAYAFVGATFVVVTAWDYFTGKEKLSRAALSLTPLLLPLACFVVFMNGSGTLGKFEWNTVSGKLLGLLSLILSYNYKVDLLFMAGLLGIFIVLIRQTQSVQVDGAVFTAGAIFTILYLLSPMLLFGSYAADVRFILPAALLLTLSLKVSIPPQTKMVLLSLFLLLACVRVAFIWRTWVTLDQRIATHVEGLKKLPVGARVYPIFELQGTKQEQKVGRSLNHVVHYATVYRDAFVPTLFSWKGQVALLFRKMPRYIGATEWRPEEWAQLADQWMPLLSNYDYVWVHGVDPKVEELLRTRCTKIDESGTFSLWQVNRQEPNVIH